MSLCVHKLSSNQYLYDTMPYCKTVQWCPVTLYINSIASSHLSYAFSYSPLYVDVIAGSVSGVVLAVVIGGVIAHHHQI